MTAMSLLINPVKRLDQLIEDPPTEIDKGCTQCPEVTKTTVPNVRPKSAVKFDLAQLGLRRKRYENNTGYFEDFGRLEGLLQKELKVGRNLLRENTEQYLHVCQAYISKCKLAELTEEKEGKINRSKEAQEKIALVEEEMQSIKKRIVTV
ncbi:Oidioi.mRNA.OKI2018_I69.PAR.g11211.t1.cds [Oikopleura dioica]|uniref:Oidioi.mRNA.OKI2018_I69.PAR.g11211.t1.cds n=1 Tax=Oikopleura dioica TaxID=34765 RepID=A0ABN7S131_OIKDI|nr:Oidioi.mRNA.OKI2018_I69.PAR.g11211.t1.cds [Oikopleura dioica]